MGSLEGRAAIVTGASRGIGLAIAQRLVELGASVCIRARASRSCARRCTRTCWRLSANAVAPAVVRTRFASVLYENREEEVAARFPLRRLGVPEDVAGLVAFLLSDEAAWITGQTIVIDGGLTVAGIEG